MWGAIHIPFSISIIQFLWKAWELPGNVGYIIENWKSINKICLKIVGFKTLVQWFRTRPLDR